MSLRRKFALLLGTLALIVLVNLGTALWSVWILERELSGPLASIGPVMADLHDIKRGLDSQVRALVAVGALPGVISPGDAGDGAPNRDESRLGNPDPGQAPAAGDEPRRLREANEFIRARLDHLESLDTYRVRAGLSTTRNVRARLDALTRAVDGWLGDRRPEALGAFAQQYRGVRDLIEIIEGQQVRVYTPAFLAFGGQLRIRVLFILSVSLLLMLMAAFLGTILVQRWVMHPVARLRDAASRIAGGDLTHRIDVQGEDELALLSSEVNHMAGTIAAMQEERVERERLAAVGEMVRRIAHNLRNPLAGIRSLAELTSLDLPSGSMPRENQDRIVQTVDRFEGWLKGLLSATSPLQTSLTPTPIADWLAQTVEPLRPLAASKSIALSQDAREAPSEAPIDPRHLEQALIAVVTNAIQASPNGSRVAVVAQRTQDDGNTWELRVSDQGPGVPTDLHERIFRPYFTTKRDGTGIGLALAKQVVEQHGGRIWVEPGRPTHANGNVGDAGAVFVMRLPLTGTGDAAATGQIPPARGVSFGHHPGH